MKRICVFTSTRADYGLLMNLMKLIKDDDSLELQILASGTHLLKKFGETYKFIEEDGFKIDSKIDIALSDSSEVGISASQGKALELYAKELSALKPDIAIVLGDRFEALSFAIACCNLKIPLAHLHGGELTLGAVDDAFRHSITKLAYWHFTATEEYRKRVIRLGEHPDRVFNVGATGVENIKVLKLIDPKTLREKLNIPWKRKKLLITFHPETNSNIPALNQIESLLSALSLLEDDYSFIFTGANADAGHDVIDKKIAEFIEKNLDRAISFKSMGQLNYLSALQAVDAVVGNSSSGIIEAPSFKIPTVNIGKRQEGRVRANSVIDCDYSSEEIRTAIEVSSSWKKENKFKGMNSPFDGGETSKLILEVLKRTIIPKNLQKEFYEGLE